MPGPRPKPTHLRIVAGNPAKRPLNQKEPKPSGDVRDPPTWLTAPQAAIWREAIAAAPLGLVKRLDEGVFLSWVIARDAFQRAAIEVAKLGLLVKSPIKGQPQQNPYLAIMNKQALLMLKAAQELGFTPSARTRIALEPSDEDDEIARKYGL